MVYSEEIVGKICQKLADGCTQKMAAYLCGINESTFYRWMEQYENFASRVESAINEYKEKLIRIVNVRSIEDGRLALEVLGRRWPDEFGAKNEVKVVSPEKKIKEVMDLIEGETRGKKDDEISDDVTRLLPESAGGQVSTDSGSK